MDTPTEGRQSAAAAFGDMSTLPVETRCPPFPLRRLGGFWLPEMILPGVSAVHTRFEPRPGDIFLASFPKSGTTWLKALAFATLSRAEHPPSDPGHPLRLRSTHDCVSFLELPFALAETESTSGGGARVVGDVFEALPSPRLLATHRPYSLLPERVVGGSSCSCRVVYVCRDPKDALVSGWLFTRQQIMAAKGAGGGKDDGDDDAPPPYPLQDAFELFCEGICVGGPQWLHVLGYWEASRRRPDKVLFLRYEEMLRDPATNVKKLAEFMGCPFTAEEEAAGTVDAVVELCSLNSLRASKGNQSGTTTSNLRIENASFFRKGAAGDWRNHLTPEMAARLDEVVDGALQGSGLTFGGGGGGGAANDSAV